MYEIVARLFNGKRLVGYRLIGEEGKLENLSIADTRYLVTVNKVKGAKVSSGNITLINGKLTDIRRINLSDASDAKGVVNDLIIIDSLQLVNNTIECNFTITAKSTESAKDIVGKITTYFRDSETKRIRVEPCGGKTLKVTNMEILQFKMLVMSGNQFDVKVLNDSRDFTLKYILPIKDNSVRYLVVKTLQEIGI